MCTLTTEQWARTVVGCASNNASKPGHSTHSYSCWWAFITSSSNKNFINKHPAWLPSKSSNFSFFIFLLCYDSHLHIFSETNSSISSTFLSYSYFRLIFWLLCYGNIGQNRLIIRNTKQWGFYKHVTCNKWWHTWSNLENKTSLPPQNRHRKALWNFRNYFECEL